MHYLIDQLLLRKKEGESNESIFKYAKESIFSNNYDKIFEIAANQYKSQNRKYRFKIPLKYNHKEHLKKADQIVLKYVEYFFNKYFSDMSNIQDFYPEKSLAIEQVEGYPFNLSGTVDLIIIYKDGNVLIIDHKTTKYADKFNKIDEKKEEDFQSMIYSYLVKNHFNLENKFFIYEIINVKTLEISTIKYPGFRGIKPVLQKISEVVDKVNSADVEQYFTPSKTTCEWCEFKAIFKRSYYGDKDK